MDIPPPPPEELAPTEPPKWRRRLKRGAMLELRDTSTGVWSHAKVELVDKASSVRKILVNERWIPLDSKDIAPVGSYTKASPSSATASATRTSSATRSPEVKRTESSPASPPSSTGTPAATASTTASGGDDNDEVGALPPPPPPLDDMPTDEPDLDDATRARNSTITLPIIRVDDEVAATAPSPSKTPKGTSSTRKKTSPASPTTQALSQHHRPNQASIEVATTLLSSPPGRSAKGTHSAPPLPSDKHLSVPLSSSLTGTANAINGMLADDIFAATGSSNGGGNGGRRSQSSVSSTDSSSPRNRRKRPSRQGHQMWWNDIQIGDIIDSKISGRWLASEVGNLKAAQQLVQVDGVWVGYKSDQIAPVGTFSNNPTPAEPASSKNLLSKLVLHPRRSNAAPPQAVTTRTSFNIGSSTGSIGYASSHHLGADDGSGVSSPNRESRASTSVTGDSLLTFQIIKMSRFGKKHHRLIVLDDALKALRILDMERKTRTEFAISDIKEVKASDASQFKLQLSFAQGHRDYDLTFTSKSEYSLFSTHLIRLLRIVKQIPASNITQIPAGGFIRDATAPKAASSPSKPNLSLNINPLYSGHKSPSNSHGESSHHVRGESKLNTDPDQLPHLPPIDMSEHHATAHPQAMPGMTKRHGLQVKGQRKHLNQVGSVGAGAGVGASGCSSMPQLLEGDSALIGTSSPPHVGSSPFDSDFLASSYSDLSSLRQNGGAGTPSSPSSGVSLGDIGRHETLPQDSIQAISPPSTDRSESAPVSPRSQRSGARTMPRPSKKRGSGRNMKRNSTMVSSPRNSDQTSSSPRSSSPAPPLPESIDLPGAPSPQHSPHPHDQYMQYHVIKLTKYRQRQRRVFVIHEAERVLRSLDENRKVRKEIALDDVMQIEYLSPVAEENSGRCQISFRRATQRPFEITFISAFELEHFAQQVKDLNETIKLSYAQDTQPSDSSDSDILRFSVVKLSKLRRKKRILYIHSQTREIRWLNENRRQTFIPVTAVISLEKDLNDSKRLTMVFEKDAEEGEKIFTFVFASAMARERCVAKLRELMSSVPGYKRSGEEITIFVGTWNLGQQPCLASYKSAVITASSQQVPATMSASPDHAVKGAATDAGVLHGVAGGDDPFDFEDPEDEPDEEGEDHEIDSGPQPLDDWIPPVSHKRFEMYAIGLQECRKHDREPCIDRIRTYLNQDLTYEDSYVLLTTHNLWQIVIFVFVHRPLLRRITNVEFSSVATGLGDVLGNKGSAACSFKYDDTSFCFINVHLAARAERIEQRRNNYFKIMRELRLGRKDLDVLSQFEHVLFFGDLNYRIEYPFHDTLTILEREDFKFLHEFDQLKKQMELNAVLYGFEEQALNFAPTYRMLRTVEGYGNKRAQTPSWTDRILKRSHPHVEGRVKTLHYQGSRKTLGSDHRPVGAIFSFTPTVNFSPESFNDSNSAGLASIFLSQFIISPLDKAHGRLSGQSSLTLTFESSFLENPVRSAAGHWDDANRNYGWSEEHGTVALTPFVSDTKTLERSSVLVSIHSVSEAALRGTVTIHMRHIFSKPRRSRVLVCKDGMPRCTLDFSLRAEHLRSVRL